jgi:DNA-binding NtrC family response regulator
MRQGTALRPAELRREAGAPAGLLRLHRHSLMNVLLVGGDRERRLEAAKAFHRESPLHHGPLLVVDCVRDERMLKRALRIWSGLGAIEPGADPLWAAACGTLFLDEVTRLGDEGQKLLLGLLRRAPHDRESNVWCGRLVVGCSADPEAVVESGSFSPELLDCLDKVRVAVSRGCARGAA